MKVRNMTSGNGNAVPNQFVIKGASIPQDLYRGDLFQSYDTVIAFKAYRNNSSDITAFDGSLYLDVNAWDYSRTTSKYRNQFTGLTTAQTKAGIKDGSIKLVDLNS